MSKKKSGPKEVITKEMANSIRRMIERMPDAGIDITWESVLIHIEKQYKLSFAWRYLSQKKWDGIKIIGDAFNLAKQTRRRANNDTQLKYRTSPRSVLQKRIRELEGKVISLEEEISRVRAQQINAYETFLNTKPDLRKLLSQIENTAP